MLHEYRQIFTALSADASIRAIVLTGAGDRAFCSGIDITSSNELFSPDTSVDAARKSFRLRRHIKEFQDCIGAVAQCEKPVIVVLHGISYGLAIDIACCADVRLCSADTRFCVKEVDIGIAADVGTLTRLPKVVGSGSWVREVAMTARLWGAEEAVNVGFVSRALPGKEQAVVEALRIAGMMAEKSPLGVQGTKALVNYSVDHSTQEGMCAACGEIELLRLADQYRIGLYGCLERGGDTGSGSGDCYSSYYAEEKSDVREAMSE